MAEIPPVAFDPRQAKIHEQLVRLGPGPAAFFRDACRAFLGLIPAETAGHFAGHCLRELKSSIKDVLYPRATKEKSDKDAIEAIAEAYGLPADHDVVKIWPELNLAALAHRDKLDRPHSLEEARGAWESIQVLLAVLLDALDGAYTKVYERLDALLAKTEPREDDLRELLGKVPNNPHTFSHFFGKVHGRKWFELLIASEIFVAPPAGGYWPQAEYLRRMATEYPDDVAPVIERVAATWSYHTQHQILSAVPSLKPAPAGRILRVSAAAVLTATGHDTYTAKEIGEKAAAIARDETEAALDVFATLLALKPAVEDPKGGWHGARELRSPLEYYTYSDLVGEPLHELIQIAPGRTFDRLLTVLDDALTSVYAKTKPDDISKGWLPAIEPHVQNTHHYDPLPRLAEAVRDAAETVLKSNPSAMPGLLDTLRSRKWQVLDRLALHLAHKFGDANDPGVQALAHDPDLFFDYDFRHEYGALLKHVFPALPSEKQERLLGWINEGPRTMPEGVGPTDATYLRESWAWIRLSWLREHLDGNNAARLEELERAHGTADETAEFSGYISGPFWGPTSPRTGDELRGLPIPELVVDLQRWTPSGDRRPRDGFSPTRDGLARQLQPVVKERAAEFAATAESFVGLDATYVRAIVAGFEDAVKANTPLDWPAVLRLCTWAVTQPREIPGRDPNGFNDDPSWSWAWAAIARLLRTAVVADGAPAVPLELRQTVWSVLRPITDDPDPNADREQEERDPYSTAINSTRGVAMEAAVMYALWIRQGMWLPDGVRGFADMPEIEELLTRHLDPGVDASPAIRSVYGVYLYHLHRLNAAWVEAHMDDLFPSDRPDLADAVLHAYLGFGQYTTKELNILLRPQFARATANIPQDIVDEEKVPSYVSHAGMRVVSMYMHGDIPLNDTLLKGYFARADERARAHVTSNVPTFVTRVADGGTDDARARAIAFWNWRLAASTDAEICAFGRWMESKQFDAAWRLAQLQIVLERIGRVDMDYQIAETLGGLTIQFPRETLCCVRLLVGPGMDMMKVHALTYRGDIQRIIHAARTSGDVELSSEATAFANELIARGMTQFREVLDPGYVPPSPEDY